MTTPARHRPLPPPNITTVDIADIFRIATRAVFDVKCISSRHIETLKHRMEWVHARYPLDLTALMSARDGEFKHDVQAVFNFGSEDGYAGPPLKFAMEQQLDIGGCDSASEPAQMLHRADNHPFVQHGHHPTWSCRAAEGVLAVIAATPELSHGLRNVTDANDRWSLYTLIHDVIQLAAKEGSSL